MHPSRFFGLSCNVGDPIIFKVIQHNIDPHKRNLEVHRGVVVLCNSAVIGYNSDLAPKSDAYFPEVHLEGGTPIKLSTP